MHASLLCVSASALLEIIINAVIFYSEIFSYIVMIIQHGPLRSPLELNTNQIQTLSEPVITSKIHFKYMFATLIKTIREG